MDRDRLWDVAVVGGGPVGLTTALLLAARGLEVVVLERNATTSNEPKAISLDDESLRTYQTAGVLDWIAPVIVPGTGTAYYDSDNQLLFTAGTPIPLFHGHPFKNPFAQPDLERALRAAAESFGDRVRLHFGTQVDRLCSADDQVTLQVAGELEGAVTARYVVGADGGRSTVREQLGVTLSGRSHGEVWLVVDTVDDPHRERYGMHHGDPVRPHVIVPGLGGRCRYEFRLFPGEGQPGDDVDFALIRKLVAPYRSLEPADVERAVTYRFHGLVADQWRVGRVFLAGDAAHMMPPFAGQGLNSGIRDAANLAWKLAAVRQGRLHSTVLDSYQAERGPHAEAVVRSSERLGRVVMTTRPGLARRRDARVRAALATEDGRRYLEQMRYRPAARFAAGLVVRPDDHELVGRQIGQPRVFDVARHRIALLDEVLGTGWAVLRVGAQMTDWASARRVAEPLQPVLIMVPLDDTITDVPADVGTVIEVDGRLTAELGAARDHFVLVRPDRFVAAVWQSSDDDLVRDAVRRWTQPPPADTPSGLRTSGCG